MDDLIAFSSVDDAAARARLRALLPSIAARAATCDETGSFPSEDIDALAKIGLLKLFSLDGADRVGLLFDCLRMIGGANLSLGRIFEGHVNAVQLIGRYGDAAARARLEEALATGALFGVWNTDIAPGMTLEPAGDGWRLNGAKRFATGTGYLDFAIVTARTPDGAKQMLVVPAGMDGGRARPDAWRVAGMRGTVSGAHDFSGLAVEPRDFLGDPGDYEREPAFTAGAWRFTAVQLGGIEALIRLLRDHLRQSGGDADPIQRARFGRAVAAARTAYLWVKEAAHRAESGPANAAAPLVLMTRGVVEDAALSVIEAVQRAVGTQAFFTGNAIDRVMRDLQLYLRQPVPDQARDRAAAAWLDRDCWHGDPWW